MRLAFDLANCEPRGRMIIGCAFAFFVKACVVDGPVLGACRRLPISASPGASTTGARSALDHHVADDDEAASRGLFVGR